MKFVRLTLCALAVAALVSGCGKSSAPTRVTPTESTPTLDNTPPPVPDNLTIDTNLSSGLSRVVWDPSAAADVAGYDVLVYDPDPARDNAYVLLASNDASITSFDLDPAASVTTKYFRVRAVDSSGNHSGLSATLRAELRPAEPAGGGDPDGRPPLPTMTP